MKKLTTNLIIILSNLLIVYFNQNLRKKLKKNTLKDIKRLGQRN
jgi:hypothetical protein